MKSIFNKNELKICCDQLRKNRYLSCLWWYFTMMFTFTKSQYIFILFLPSFQLNLKRECPFWTDHDQCAVKNCAIDTCSEVYRNFLIWSIYFSSTSILKGRIFSWFSSCFMLCYHVFYFVEVILSILKLDDTTGDCPLIRSNRLLEVSAF